MLEEKGINGLPPYRWEARLRVVGNGTLPNNKGIRAFRSEFNDAKALEEVEVLSRGVAPLREYHVVVHFLHIEALRTNARLRGCRVRCIGRRIEPQRETARCSTVLGSHCIQHLSGCHYCSRGIELGVVCYNSTDIFGDSHTH